MTTEEIIKIAIDKALEEVAKRLFAEAYKDIDRQIFFYHFYESKL